MKISTVFKFLSYFFGIIALLKILSFSFIGATIWGLIGALFWKISSEITKIEQSDFKGTLKNLSQKYWFNQTKKTSQAKATNSSTYKTDLSLNIFDDKKDKYYDGN